MTSVVRTVTEHTHTDSRPTFGCDACIEAMHSPKVRDDDGLSATQKLTLRNRQQFERGIHPATLLRLRRDVEALPGRPETCGGCAHHHNYQWHNGHFHKCDLHRLGESHSAASDIRVSWPACSAWEAVTS